MANQVVKPPATHAQQAKKKLEIGWMGLIFGDASEKPGNIAALVLILAFIGIISIAIYMPDADNSPKGEMLTLFGGVITTALGFLFGRSKS